MPDLPIGLDVEYPDSPLRPSVKTHQQHHDVVHAVVNRVPDDGSLVATEATVSATYARVARGPFGWGSALGGRLTVGQESTNLLLLGDSTGNGATDWFRTWITALAPDYPKVTFTDAVWSDTAQAYDPPTVIQQGNGTGDVIASDTFERADGTPGNSDSGHTWTGGTISGGRLTVPTGTAWLNAGVPDVDVVVTAYPGASGSIRLRLKYAAAGTNEVFADVTTTTMNVYRRVAGTATQIGVAYYLDLVAGQPYTLTGKSRGPFVEFSINGKTVTAMLTMETLAALPDTNVGLSGASAAFDALTVRAAPTMRAINGSHPGATTAYSLDAGRFPKQVLNGAAAPNWAIVNYGHNETAIFEPSGITTLAEKVVTDRPGARLILSTQNPEKAPRLTVLAHRHAVRNQRVADYAIRNRHGLIDVYLRFLGDDPTFATLVGPDGVHPTQAGYDTWADEAAREMAAT